MLFLFLFICFRKVYLFIWYFAVPINLSLFSGVVSKQKNQMEEETCCGNGNCQAQTWFWGRTFPTRRSVGQRWFWFKKNQNEYLKKWLSSRKFNRKYSLTATYAIHFLILHPIWCYSWTKFHYFHTSTYETLKKFRKSIDPKII